MAFWNKFFNRRKPNAETEEKNMTEPQAKFSLSAAGNYTVEVESRSDHAASWALRSGKIPFTVKKSKDISIESISLNQTTLSLRIGQSARLISSILPEGASTETVGMFSGNPAVATVDAKGLVTAVNVGETTKEKVEVDKVKHHVAEIATAKRENTVQTGDSTPLGFLIVLLTLSAAGFVYVLIRKKKRA